MKTKDIGLLVSYEENNYSKYCIEKRRKKDVLTSSVAEPGSVCGRLRAPVEFVSNLYTLQNKPAVLVLYWQFCSA